MDLPFYKKLKENDSIRLLLLEPGTRDSPISCRLHKVRLSSHPKYIALSYTWGDPVLSYSIRVNGRPRAVRYNLYTALQYLRDPTQVKTLWIDALTINQEDIPERNQQVRIMGQIYKNSHETIVWLREERPEDESALRLLHLCDVLVSDDTMTTESKRLRISNSFFQNEEAKLDDVITSLLGLVMSNWFRRVWVVQEFALSRSVILHCGDTTFSPDGLFLLNDAWKDSPNASFATAEAENLREPMKQLTAFQYMREAHRNSVRADMGYLLFGCSHFEATEPRDSVFALLSLVNASGPTLAPDYNLTTAQVFSKAVQIASETGTLFLMLCLACRRPLSVLQSSLPSWVPDFHGHYEQYITLQSHADIFSAGGSKKSAFSFSDDELILTLRGKILDVISTLLTDVPKKNSPWDMYRAWYRKCEELGISSGSYPSGEPFSDCWWRMIVFDIHISRRYEYSRASTGFDSFYLDQAILGKLTQEEPFRTKQLEYLLGAIHFSSGMAFCRTVKRYLCWISPLAKSDDRICLFEGAAAPWVIRPKSDGTFQLIGEAYVHGIMYGEAIEWEGSEWENIQLS